MKHFGVGLWKLNKNKVEKYTVWGTDNLQC